MKEYVGRLAPSPTGWLHLGHARTFWRAWARCGEVGGELRLRIEDLDPHRSKPEFVAGCLDDFKWMGIEWSGEAVFQSKRRGIYAEAWERLRSAGLIYPCRRSRKDVREAAGAPHEGEDGEPMEPIFPRAWRAELGAGGEFAGPGKGDVNWRFRVPDDRTIRFTDGGVGEVSFVAGKDFGDFVVWRRDDVPAYELAVVVDDAAMGITEVVRGVDLLRSTARQLLVYEALEELAPTFFHVPLVCDAEGRRLSKREGAMGLRELRGRGLSFSEALAMLPEEA